MMNFGVIGSAHGHIYSFINDMLNSGCIFKGIYNDGSDISKDIAMQFKVPLFDRMNELFEQKIEVAGTSAINNIKIDIIEECARHNVHIMADKPIVTEEDHYIRLKKIIEAGKIQVGLMLTVRFLPSVYTLKKLIDRGTIGQLLSIEIFNPHKLSPETRPDWHFNKKQNGGIAVDLFVHSIDTFAWLTGSKITHYNGMMAKSILREKTDFYDSSQFMVYTDAGITGYFRVDWHVPQMHWSWGDMRIFCTGSKGLIEARAVGDPVTKEQQLILYGMERETENVILENPDKTETTDFIDRIRGKDHIVTHDDILEATRLSIGFDKCAELCKFI